MSLSPLEYLRHIRDETVYLCGEVVRLTKEQFLQDETAKRAFARSIEIIGEAAKKIPFTGLRYLSDGDGRHFTGLF